MINILDKAWKFSIDCIGLFSPIKPSPFFSFHIKKKMTRSIKLRKLKVVPYSLNPLQY